MWISTLDIVVFQDWEKASSRNPSFALRASHFPLDSFYQAFRIIS